MLNARELTEEDTKVLKKKAMDILSVCRRNILSKYPFIGNIALRMEMVPVRDVRVRTACTDGNSVYFDIAFLSSLGKEEQMFVLAHEIWHAVMLHLVRRHNRNPDLFNIATDKEVNYMLKQDGFISPDNLCFPTKDEEGKCAEEIYEMMLKDMKQNQMKMKGMNGGAGGNSNNKDKSNSSSGNSSSPGNGKNSKKSKDGKDDGTLTGQFDKHIFDGDSDDDSNDDNKNTGNRANGEEQDSNSQGKVKDHPNSFKIVDKYGEVGFDSDFQPKVSKDFADRMRETIISEAQRTEKMKGSLPAHIKSLVKELCTPEIKWQEVLAQFVTRCYNSGNRSWIPPNRRHVHNDVYLQSRQAERIKIAVGIDTSGSTMGDRSKFLGELHSLIKSFGLFDLHIVECDAEVGAYKHYTQDDNLEFEIDNGEYAMSGGGGTAMLPIYNYILDNQIECDCLCIMTDGYIDHIPTNPIPSLPTLWIITKNGTEDFCDWGQKIRLKTDDMDMN